MTLEEARAAAKARFVDLVRLYGIQWRADVPASAWLELAECNRLLTEKDRREALGFRG